MHNLFGLVVDGLIVKHNVRRGSYLRDPENLRDLALGRGAPDSEYQAVGLFPYVDMTASHDTFFSQVEGTFEYTVNFSNKTIEKSRPVTNKPIGRVKRKLREMIFSKQ